MMRQVAITGIGVVTPIGNHASEFSKALKEGLVGVSDVTRFPTVTNGLPRRAFQVRGFIPPRYVKIHDPFIQYIMHATEEALRDSGLDRHEIDRERIGIAVSSSKGGMYTFEKFYDRFMNHPSALLGARVYANFIPNIASQWIARRWKIWGPAKPAVAACATGLYAILEGVRMIEQGEADYCIAGAGEASITQLMT